MQAAAVSTAILDIIKRLAVYIPRSQHLVQALLNEPTLTVERASQTLLDVWKVSLNILFDSRNFQHAYSAQSCND